MPKVLVLDDDELTHSAVEMSAGDLARIIHTSSPVDAFRLLQEQSIDIIVSGSKLGTMDLTHLLSLLKRQHPTLVSIVVSAEHVPALDRLIEQGKIFRHAAKPLKAGLLRANIKAAIAQQECHPGQPAILPSGMEPPGRLSAFRQTLTGNLLALLRRLWRN